MSIPKEPRQLMINLMYLVLTAMLALNVSAEIMNTFLDLDDSLAKSNSLSDKAINETIEAIKPVLEKKNVELKNAILTGISSVQASTKELSTLVGDYRTLMVDEFGDKNGIIDAADFDPVKHVPLGMKNKDISERIMLHTKDGAISRAEILKDKINDTATKMVDAYKVAMKAAQKQAKLSDKEIADKIAAFENNISLKVTEAWKLRAKDGTKTWGKYKFGHMPLAAVLPVLRKIEADAKNAEVAAVNDLAALAGGREIKLNKFFPVINAKKGYVIKGEKFEADVSMGAYSSELTGVVLKVNGTRLNVNSDGVGKFSETANTTGKRKLSLSVSVTNPITQEVSNGTSEFEYEVGVRSANVTADKMNVFYIGVDNPISVVVAGVSSNKIQVTASGCTKTGSNGKYVVRATKPTDNAKITVSGGGLPSTPFKFRVKRIPDPVPVLGTGPTKKGGGMKTGEFKAQLGMAAILENFDFEARCNIVGYEITKVARRQDAISKTNRGGRYNDDAKRMVRSAKPGDIYYFDNIKAKCPGDNASRRLGSVVYKIK